MEILITIGLVIFVIAAVIAGVGRIMLLIAGFREHVGWGLGMFFVGGIVDILFIVLHWEESKKAFQVMMSGFLFGAMGFVLMSTGGFQMSKEGLSDLPVDLPVEEAAPEPEVPEPRPSAPVVAAPLEDDPGMTNEPAEVITDFVGLPISKLKELRGEPRAELHRGRRTVLLYDNERFISYDGRTIAEQE